MGDTEDSSAAEKKIDAEIDTNDDIVRKLEDDKTSAEVGLQGVSTGSVGAASEVETVPKTPAGDDAPTQGLVEVNPPKVAPSGDQLQPVSSMILANSEVTKESEDDVTIELQNDVTKELHDVTKEIQDDVTKELQDDVTKEIQDDFTKELLDDVAKELQDDVTEMHDDDMELQGDVTKDSSDKVTKESEDDVTEKLQDDVIKDLQDDDTNELQDDVTGKLPDDIAESLQGVKLSELKNMSREESEMSSVVENIEKTSTDVPNSISEHKPVKSVATSVVIKKEVIDLDCDLTRPPEPQKTASVSTPNPTVPTASTDSNNSSNLKIANLSVATSKIILIDTRYDPTKERCGDRLTKMKSYVCGTCKWCLRFMCGVCLPCVQQENVPHSLLWELVNSKIPPGNRWRFICQDVQKCSAFKTLIEPNMNTEPTSKEDSPKSPKLGFDTPEDVNEVSKVKPLVLLPTGHPLENDISGIFSIQDLMKATQAEQKMKRANALKGYMGRPPRCGNGTPTCADGSNNGSSISTRSGSQTGGLTNQQDKQQTVKSEEHTYSRNDTPLSSVSEASSSSFDIWEYFEKGPDVSKVKCKLCGQVRVRIISGLKYHVATKHKVKVDLDIYPPQESTNKPSSHKVGTKRRAARSLEVDSSDDFSEADSNDDEGRLDRDQEGEAGDKSDENLSADDECIMEASMDDLKLMQEAEISEAIRLGTMRSKVRIRPEIFSQSFQLKVGRFLSDGGSMKALSERLDLTLDTLRSWRRAHEHKTVEDKLKKQKKKAQRNSSSSQKSVKTEQTSLSSSLPNKPISTIINEPPRKPSFVKNDTSSTPAVTSSAITSAGNAITFQFNPNNRPIPKGVSGPGTNPLSMSNIAVSAYQPQTSALIKGNISNPVPIQPKTSAMLQQQAQSIARRVGGVNAIAAMGMPQNPRVITQRPITARAPMPLSSFTPVSSAAQLQYCSRPPIISYKSPTPKVIDNFGEDLFIIYDKGASDISDEETDYDDDVIPKAVVQESLPFLCNYCREIFRTPEILQHHLYDCSKRKSQLSSNQMPVGTVGGPRPNRF